MALAILDGTQTATTLSSVVTGGEHIVAHSVVSLGSNAISNIATAVSGSTVCVGNLGLLQSTVATEGLPASGSFIKIGGHTGTSTTGNIAHVSAVGAIRVDGSNYTQPISGTVTVGTLPSLASNTDFVAVGEYLAEGMNNYGVIGVQVSNSSVTIGNSVTIGSLPAISGTVTANLGNVAQSMPLGGTATIPSSAVRIGWADEEQFYGVGTDAYGQPLPIQIHLGGSEAERVTTANPLPISGTVTANPTGTQTIAGSVTASISNSVTIASLPAISGTVTANINTFPDATNIGEQIAQGFTNYGSFDVSISGTANVSGTVTANTFALQGTAVTTSNFTSTTASTALANYNATRQVLTIFNEGAGNLHIAPGATCTTIAYQVRLSSGDYYEVPNHQTTITHSAVFATAGTARVTQVS
jgi:hypothetical protein